MARRALTTVLMLLLLLLGLSACGGGDGDEDGEPAGGGTTLELAADPDGGFSFDKKTLEAGQRTETFRGRRFKVTFGTAAARIRQNGKDYRVAESRDPVGYQLRSGKRPERIRSGLAGCT